jgi:hypothetical protein
MAKKFPLGRVKELAAHVASMHETLQSLIADCDSTAEDDKVGAGTIKNTTRKPAQDDSDAGQPWAGQDSARVKTMDQAFPNFGRLGAGGASVSADVILKRK